MRLPEEFTQKMRRLMDQEEYATFIRELKRKVMIQSLRVNTKKIPVGEFLRIFPYELTPVPWCAEGFYLPKGFKASKHPYYYAGLYYSRIPVQCCQWLLWPRSRENGFSILFGAGRKGDPDWRRYC